jgi:hypothetical protein
MNGLAFKLATLVLAAFPCVAHAEHWIEVVNRKSEPVWVALYYRWHEPVGKFGGRVEDRCIGWFEIKPGESKRLIRYSDVADATSGFDFIAMATLNAQGKQEQFDPEKIPYGYLSNFVQNDQTLIPIQFYAKWLDSSNNSCTREVSFSRDNSGAKIDEPLTKTLERTQIVFRVLFNADDPRVSGGKSRRFTLSIGVN